MVSILSTTKEKIVMVIEMAGYQFFVLAENDLQFIVVLEVCIRRLAVVFCSKSVPFLWISTRDRKTQC